MNTTSVYQSIKTHLENTQHYIMNPRSMNIMNKVYLRRQILIANEFREFHKAQKDNLLPICMEYRKVGQW